jgi:hypothetical protein
MTSYSNTLNGCYWMGRGAEEGEGLAVGLGRGFRLEAGVEGERGSCSMDLCLWRI